MNELNQFIEMRHTMYTYICTLYIYIYIYIYTMYTYYGYIYIIRLWRISESLGFIWSIPPHIR